MNAPAETQSEAREAVPARILTDEESAALMWLCRGRGRKAWNKRQKKRA